MDNTEHTRYPIATTLGISFTVFILSFIWISSENLAYSQSESSSLGQSIQQFQQNLQSAINKEIQSSKTNETCSNSYSIQSQTNNNGITKTITKSSCDNSILSSIDLTENVNLKGVIASAEHNLATGNIIKNVYGNWSFVTHNGTQEFKSSFIVQPIVNNTNNLSISQHSVNTPLPIKNNNTISEYSLSNFKTNSIVQQNSDRSFQGFIDIVKNTKPVNGLSTNHVSNFKNMPVTISIIGDKTLVISFNEQKKLFSDFENIPLVGLVK